MKDLSALLASISLAEKIDSRKTSHPLPFMSDTKHASPLKKSPIRWTGRNKKAAGEASFGVRFDLFEIHARRQLFSCQEAPPQLSQDIAFEAPHTTTTTTSA